MKTWWVILSVALGGAFGALSRYGISSWIASYIPEHAPWPTFLVNILGCLLFGYVFAASVEGGWIPHHYRPLLLTGFMGSLTTFSTFMFDNQILLLRKPDYGLLTINIVGQLVVGLVCFLLGTQLAKLHTPA